MSDDSLTLEQFFDSQLRNSWIYEESIKVYIRKGYHVVNGSLCSCLDLASVEVDRKQRGKGVFSTLLKKLEAIAQEQGWPLYVENIHNKALVKSLLKRGYVSISLLGDVRALRAVDCGIAPCLIKLLPGGICERD